MEFKQHICWLNIPMDYIILMQKTNCLGELFKDSQVLNELKLMQAIVGIIGNLGEEISCLHFSNDGSFCNIGYWALVNIQIILANVGAF